MARRWILALAVGSVLGCAVPQTTRLTILHLNDMESQWVDAGPGLEDFGGLARAATLIRRARAEAERDGSGVVLVSAGDNVLVGPELEAGRSGETRARSLDAEALAALNFDAVGLGNHDFDLGPEWLAHFIEEVGGAAPFLSTNLDVEDEASLASEVDAGRLGSLHLVERAGRRIGILSIVTPELAAISSPGRARADPDLVARVTAGVKRLQERGAEFIVLLSHLQGIERELALARDLRGVHVIVAGGGDEVLVDDTVALVPGDERTEDLHYPMRVRDAEGREVLVVTTPGELRYVGRLNVELSDSGPAIRVLPRSGLLRVASEQHADGVSPDGELARRVVEPLRGALAQRANRVLAVSKIALDGRRRSVRSGTTNLGDLIADAMLWQIARVSSGRPGSELRRAPPHVALMNGGGIRVNAVLRPGPLTALDTSSMLPFTNALVSFRELPAERLACLLEHGLSRAELGDGRFPQIGGMRLVWDPSRPGRERPVSSVMLSRLRELELVDGTVLVREGRVVPGARPVNLVTTTFLARGGDGYPLGGLEAEFLPGITARWALDEYLERGLSGSIEIPTSDEPRARLRLSP